MERDQKSAGVDFGAPAGLVFDNCTFEIGDNKSWPRHPRRQLRVAGAARSLLIAGMVAIALATLFVLVQGCAASTPSDGGEGISRACYRSFAPTLVAWEAAFVRAPEQCAYLDQEYTVQLLHESGEFRVCTPEAGSWTVAGCTQPETRTIYLLASDDDVQMTDTSVHEWVHALADCVDGDRDALHLRAELWADYGPNTVEAQALASAEIGECL